jgi:ionotropic glutamate receptor
VIVKSFVIFNFIKLVTFFSFHSGSPWRDKISLVILDLQEKGVLQLLYNKWWRKQGVTCSRQDKLSSKEGKANALGVENIGGVFVVLLAGLALAIFTAFGEFIFRSKSAAYTNRVNYIF